jgi:acyl carrier protein
MPDRIDDRLTECFAAVFPSLTPDEIQRSNSLSIPEWDSMATVTLVALINEEFGIEIAPEDYNLATSFALLRDYVKSASND